MNTALLLLSLVASAPVVADRDVAYVDNAHRLQNLDVYSTLEGEGRPVVVYVHGGGWRFGDKKAVGQKVDALVRDRGYVFVSVNYRFHPEVSFREQAADVASAISWVRKHAADYGGAGDRIVLMGHSAGAHLAALTACDPQYLKAVDTQPAFLRGVILLDGAGYNIVEHLKSAGAVARNLYTTVFGSDPAVQREASPLHHVGESAVPPFLVTHVASRPDSTAQSTRLVEAIVAAGGKAERITAEGKSHATINRDVGDPEDEFSKRVMAFIESVVASEK